MNEEKIIELVYLYITDSMDENELAELTGAFQAEPERVRNIYVKISGLNLLLPTAGILEIPSSSVKEKIMSAISKKDLSSDYKIVKPFELNFMMRLAYGLAVICLVISLIIGYNYSELNRKSVFQEKRIEELTDILVQNEALLDVLNSKNVRLASMNGLDIVPQSYGKIIWSEDNKSAILQISKLPTINTDKDYQLWAIESGKPVSWGIFSISADSINLFFRLEQVKVVTKENINAFAVTLEPKGGVPQPTGKMYLLGKTSL
jgi:Anti-sigma-K factor rskA